MSGTPARHNASPRPRRVRRGLSAASPRKATGSRAIWIEEDEELLGEVESDSSRPQDTIDRSRRTSQAPSKKPSQVRQSLAGAGSGTTSRQRPQPKGPSLSETFSYLLVPLDLLNRLMSTLLSPILAHVVNSVILLGLGFLALYFLLPFLLSRVKWGFLGSLRVLWNVLRGKGTGLSLPGIPDFKNISPRAIYGAVRGTGGLCSSIYLPLLCSRKTKNETYDVGRVARALHKEAQNAQNIFESVISLGTGGVENGLYHTKMWELASAIKIGSHLPDKDKLGTELMMLGDMSRDLSDEISSLYAQTNNAFSWIANDFERLNRLLLTADPKPAPKQLEAMIHKVMLRTQDKFDTLYLATEKALPAADRASTIGGGLMHEMMEESYRLGWEVREAPKWKDWVEVAKEAAVGIKEPSKREILKTDLALSQMTVDNLKDIRSGLENTLRLLRLHRTHVGSFSSSMMGFHLGSGGFADENDEDFGLGAEAELEVLSKVVAQMKMAVQDGRGGSSDKEHTRTNPRIAESHDTRQSHS